MGGLGQLADPVPLASVPSTASPLQHPPSPPGPLCTWLPGAGGPGPSQGLPSVIGSGLSCVMPTLSQRMSISTPSLSMVPPLLHPPPPPSPLFALSAGVGGPGLSRGPPFASRLGRSCSTPPTSQHFPDPSQPPGVATSNRFSDPRQPPGVATGALFQKHNMSQTFVSHQVWLRATFFQTPVRHQV